MPNPPFVSSRLVAKALTALVAAMWFASIAGAAAISALPGLRYVSPMPGSGLVTPESNVIVRLLDPISLRSAELAGAFVVTGSKSGPHSGRALQAGDGVTVLFKPDQEFLRGEAVTVELRPPLVPAGAKPVSFWFSVAAIKPAAVPLSLESEFGTPRSAAAIPDNVDSLPAGLPPITASIYSPPTAGALFLSNVSFGPPNVPFLLILDNGGNPLFYRQMRSSCFDFKVQPNGLMTYMDLAGGKFYAMNDSYSIVDSFACGNGYTTDIHEMRLLANGHALLMAYDTQIVDMSVIVPGGNPAAQVVGLIVQEVDDQQNVYFQWRSWDYFQITDATHENMTAGVIDYIHGNAIEEDTDGNLMISSRHLDEITKIDRSTAQVMWRWGGKHNQFTFIGDTLPFSHQHAIRRLANGHVTLYDNGNFHAPQFSRALEYNLDETAKTAEVVWQYRGNPDIYGLAMGYVQRLDNGNTLISWGAGKPDLSEVAPDGTRLMDITFPNQIFTYRAYRFLPASLLAAPPTANPARVTLSAVYPNPARQRAQMTLRLTRDARVSAGVFDLSGRQVLRILDRVPFEAGSHPITLDLSHQRPGLYFCTVSLDGQSQTRKMLLIH